MHEPNGSLPSLQLRDVIGGGWNYYQIDGDIPAAATDGVRRYFVLDHGEAAELAVGGLSDVTRYAVPVAPTAVAPDASDPWAAWIVTAGALRHVDQSAVGEPLLRDIGALGSEGDAIVVAQCDAAGARVI